ncbi:PVC-type heme-binding CxxCH protein [Verrucomicrobium spinosum]|uniref:PVC-type heme-binding CxxCH protein n=1 Tax=Verrucomicrobium spinosum TaxID=2736 RepID=UPI0009E6AE4C|nr:PVC-type heme-binding CxxCH protein [Verrucomicrobium spinosum]
MSRKIIVLAALLYHLGSQSGSGEPPQYTLPEGLELVSAAAPPLVHHPIMGCVDPQGALYLGDAAGLNLNKAELETQLPNRVLKLVDDNADGVYDRATVFADKMTFPQGACWHEGALYVASPPGIWRLRDADGDGVAEERTMIVGGFDYTGNAADVHGPFLHPNGRLYWCHGRKGHRVVQSAGGKLVHEGLASGIWSCQPDGSDVRWHSLGCADNPTEIDFTPEGDIIGTCNLYYSQPRGDTLMHWLEGGVYERADMMKAITGLPRTLERMPVIHNFGHVAVSGCTFDRTGVLFPPSAGKRTLFVTHFNTQRVVRMELEPLGSTYKAVEREFLKIHDPEAHLTDVIEDRDGSLLVLDTGGWFRIGCPSSLMAKPDVKGAVYRIRKSGQGDLAPPLGKVPRPPSSTGSWAWQTEEEIRAALTSGVLSRQRMACDAWRAGLTLKPCSNR